MSKVELIENWWGDDTAMEALMEDEHTPQWIRMIELMEEKDIKDKTILDFGCNQGGFLRLLHAMKPFGKAIGVDIAQTTIEQAKARSEGLPATFIASADITKEGLDQSIDIAFSNEVVYLVPDLTAHAQALKNVLKDGGVYYLSLSSHTDNPLWPRWRELIAQDSSVALQDYSLAQIADTFVDEGFSVAAQPFKPEGFLPVSRTNEWFGTPLEVFDYYYKHKVLFRIEK